MGEKALRPQATELNRGLRRMVTRHGLNTNLLFTWRREMGTGIS